MGEAFLVRVFADTSSVGYYSPLLDGCPALLPVPEPRLELEEAPAWLDPRAVRDPCSGRPLESYMPEGSLWVLHRDPRLDLGFYTEPLGRRGRLPRSRLRRGWLLVFASGLAVYPRGFWERPRRRGEVMRAFRDAVASGRAGVYAVAGLLVDEVVEVRSWNGAPGVLRESPHAAVGEPALAVLGRVLVPPEPMPLDPRLARGRLRARLGALRRGRFRLGPLGSVDEALDLLGF